jgi:hypothetical protein
MFVLHVVVGCLDMNKEEKYWKKYYMETPDIKLYNMNRKLIYSRLPRIHLIVHPDEDHCIRCGNFINSQTYFGVLCEKCNELWFKGCEEKNLDPISPNGVSKEFWDAFVSLNPSRRF